MISQPTTKKKRNIHQVNILQTEITQKKSRRNDEKTVVKNNIIILKKCFSTDLFET